MSSLLSILFGGLVPLTLLLLGYAVGKTVERRHLRSLDRREAALRHIVTSNLKQVTVNAPIVDVSYVDGQAVIGSDYFKTFASALKSLFGGEVKSLQTLMTRARREAHVRMLEKANEIGATLVCNIRFETSTVGARSGGAGLITAEIHAYGTAICVDARRAV